RPANAAGDSTANPPKATETALERADGMRRLRGCKPVFPSLRRTAMPVVAGEESTAPSPRRTRSRPRRTTRTRAASRAWDRSEYLVARAIFGFLGMLPLTLALRVGEAVTWMVWLVAVPLRRVGMMNLTIAFPDKPQAERARILRASMLNLGRMAAELAHLPRLSDGELREMVQ